MAYPRQMTRRLLYIYTPNCRTPLYTDTFTQTALYTPTAFTFNKLKINYMWYMNYFSSEELDCVCFIEEKSNNVVIKFFGMPNNESAELFTSFIMMKLGFEYTPFNGDNHSKSIH